MCELVLHFPVLTFELTYLALVVGMVLGFRNEVLLVRQEEFSFSFLGFLSLTSLLFLYSMEIASEVLESI